MGKKWDLQGYTLFSYSKIPILRPPLEFLLKTTFGQSQRRSLIRGTLGIEKDERVT